MTLNKFLITIMILLCSKIATAGTIPFISTWQTTTANETITIPVSPFAIYNYTINWGDGDEDQNQTGDITHTYVTPGIHTVSITGDYPRIRFGDSPDEDKVLTIEQWGNSQWTSMNEAFNGCSNLQGNFTDIPDLSNVTDMGFMFLDATSFNWPINNWDVSNVTEVNNMFNRAIAFNQDLSNWDVGNITDMSSMFQDADDFNGDITTWNTINVQNMSQMFLGANNFNQDINLRPGQGFPLGADAWNTSSVTNMTSMFSTTASFNGNIGDWNVSSVTNMRSMFFSATAFDSDISSWNVSSVTEMTLMFFNASSFNQDI